MSQYNKLYTPQDSAVVFIDHQPQMLFGVSGIDRAAFISNVTLLAKAAKEFNVPTVLTAVETEGFSGYVFPQLLDVFPGQPIVERSSMNSWDDLVGRAGSGAVENGAGGSDSPHHHRRDSGVATGLEEQRALQRPDDSP